ncbi:MAG: urease accessory protein UreD [Verrucomicrobiota bacterium]
MAGSLQSEVCLSFEEREGRTVLSRREAGGLCHVGKGYWDGKVLRLHVVNPTAGMFAGDDLGVRVEVEERAQVSLVTPSATRFHAMKGGKAALRQDLRVGREAFLEFLPEWTIPQAGSEVRQETRIEVGEGGRLIFGEMLAPGRVAHGESHGFRRFENQFELIVGKRLVALERMDLRPEKGGWPLAVEGWETCFYGGVWLVGCDSELVETCEEWENEEFKVGFSEVEEGVVVVRMLAARSLFVRKGLAEVREILGRADSRLFRSSVSMQVPNR